MQKKSIIDFQSIKNQSNKKLQFLLTRDQITVEQLIKKINDCLKQSASGTSANAPAVSINDILIDDKSGVKLQNLNDIKVKNFVALAKVFNFSMDDFFNLSYKDFVNKYSKDPDCA